MPGEEPGEAGCGRRGAQGEGGVPARGRRSLGGGPRAHGWISAARASSPARRAGGRALRGAGGRVAGTAEPAEPRAQHPGQRRPAGGRAAGRPSAPRTAPAARRVCRRAARLAALDAPGLQAKPPLGAPGLTGTPKKADTLTDTPKKADTGGWERKKKINPARRESFAGNYLLSHPLGSCIASKKQQSTCGNFMCGPLPLFFLVRK